VESAIAFKNGTLHVTFGDTELTVSPSPPHEASEVVGPGPIRIVCDVRGDLAVWS
jgi:Family of unknown function (DUF6188)